LNADGIAELPVGLLVAFMGLVFPALQVAQVSQGVKDAPGSGRVLGRSGPGDGTCCPT
jgi:hypothetical protein